ncbi:PH domain-containing protein [Pseudarthrobacter sp. P1]|uniref:PH domain-containing protein n=1 Tax=Pseudarthrobacter sp. P1 TaxID=3418418 RepID=UPI003CEED776
MRSWLAPGEQVIATTRPHAGVLLFPAAVAVLLPSLVGLVMAWLESGHYQRWAPNAPALREPAVVVVLALAAMVLLFYPLRRYLAWLGTRYTLTSRRIVVRGGWLRRTRFDYPLATVRNLGSRQSLLARLWRSGTIALDMGFDGAASIKNVPEVAAFSNYTLEAIGELPHSALAPTEPQRVYADEIDDTGWEGMAHGGH